MLASLGLAAGYLVLASADPDAWLVVDHAAILAGLHATLVLGVWWLGAIHSPVARWFPPAAEFYPIATALAAISAVHLGRRFTDPGSWLELGWLGDARSAAARNIMATQAVVLAVVAVAFTGGSVAGTTVATLVMASVAVGLAAFANRWDTLAGLSAIAWTCAWSYLGVLVARRVGWLEAQAEAACFGVSTVVSAFLLWMIAGWLRAVDLGAKGRAIAAEDPDLTLGRRFALVIESVASAAGLVASAVVLSSIVPVEGLSPWVALGGVGVLLAAAVLHVALVSRWQTGWPVYAAQALMVGAYVVFRRGYPLSSAADAAVLTLLGYLDMAIAEALARFDPRGHYFRPTQYSSLVLPILPLLQIFRAGGLDEISLYYLAAAATFYATACGRMRWKWLGYAAAVFANATLWMLWSRIGWRMAEYPQFYLVPVGFSAILFAEVNRELGRSTVNLIRSVGLVVIYASLALPIWQFASFGAWLTLLVASLLGIFLGIGLRLQTFLWLGLATFVLDVVYEMGRVSLEHAMAKWLIMWAFGIAMVLFVALNEKKRILGQMLDLIARARTWE